MPLDILLILVIGGITAIAALLHFSGCSTRAVMSPDAARSAWLRHFPEDRIQQVLTARDGHAALLQLPQGLGLIWAFGADTVARHLIDYELHDSPHGVRITFHDFSAPGISLTLTEPERAQWRQLISSVREAP